MEIHEDFCKEWMNQYPVLFVSFKDVEAENFDSAYKMLLMKLADVCKSLTSVFEGRAVDKDDRWIFEKLKSRSIHNESSPSIKTIGSVIIQLQ